jgi:hypothetical protein
MVAGALQVLVDVAQAADGQTKQDVGAMNAEVLVVEEGHWLVPF